MLEIYSLSCDLNRIVSIQKYCLEIMVIKYSFVSNYVDSENIVYIIAISVVVFCLTVVVGFLIVRRYKKKYSRVLVANSKIEPQNDQIFN